MPQLSKKNFVKSQKAHDTFKPPLLTKENIEKVLGDSKTPNSSNKPSSKTSSISSKSKKNTIRKVVSIQLSFEEPNSQSSYSDISYRMNEPAVKDAYLHFVKNLSQATMNDTICSTPLVDKYDDSEDIFTPSEKLVQDDEIKVLSQDEKEKASGDSGFPLSQEMLNSQEVKEKYLDFMNNMMETDEFNFMKNFKEPAKKKTRKSISVSHSEGSEKSLIKKQNNIENEPTKKKPKQIKEPVKKLVSKKQEGSKSKSVFKEPRRKKDKKVKQNIINKINKNASKENDESVEDDNTLSLREKMLLIQESRNVGLYCLCDTCDKARYLPDIKDPLDLPTKWYCSMNPDPDHNKCSDPEEALVDEEFLVENLFNAGSIVWAKMDGYPWWPAMVEDDPDTEDYFYFEKEDDSKPTHYHVTFFDSYDVTRAWLRPTFLQPFKINMTNPQFKIPKFNKFQSRVEFAFKQAQDAVNLSLIDRLKKYSFIQRYTKPLLNKVVQKKLSKRVLKPKKQGTEEIFLAKKKHKVCRRILSSGSENSNISVIMNNMDWQNDNIDLNIIEKTLDF